MRTNKMFFKILVWGGFSASIWQDSLESDRNQVRDQGQKQDFANIILVYGYFCI